MILALNGSPRPKGNTAAMLQAALNGASSTGAETRLIQLYPLKYKGCVSCFSCKIKGGRHGVCAMKDELSPVLEQMAEAEAIIFGSPIYYYDVTPELLGLLHRFMFSNMLYTKENRSVTMLLKIAALSAYLLFCGKKLCFSFCKINNTLFPYIQIK